MINGLKNRQFKWAPLLVVLAMAAGCDEAKLPPVPDASVAKPDTVAETVNTAGQPAFVDEGVPRFDPKRKRRTPEQVAQTQEDIKNGVVFNHLEVLPDVKLASQRVADEVDLSPTGMTVPLKGNEAMLDLKPGAVLVGGATQGGQRRGGKGDNAFGFLRKVKSVEKVGDSVVIQTELAKINEVFAGSVNMAADASLAADINADGIELREYFPDLHKDFEKMERRRGGWEQRHGPWGIDKKWALWGFKVGGEHSFPIDIDQTVDGVPVSVAGEFKVKAEAGVETGIGIGIDVDTPFPDLWNSSINYFRVFAYGLLWAEAGVWLQVKAEVASELEAKVDEILDTLQLDNPLKPQIPDEFTLGEYGPKAGPTIVAGPVVIPTTYLIEVLAQCQTKVSSSITATANAGLKGEVKFGIEYLKGKGIQPIQTMEFKKWKEFKITDGALTATVQCWVGPRMHWLIGGVVGPYIDARAGLRGTMKYESTCPKPNTLESKIKPAASMQFLIDIGLKVMLGGTIKFADLYDYSPNVTLYEGWWEMFKKTFYDLPSPPTWCPSDCENGKQDNAESGVDCGPGCNGCPLGSKCKSNWDCKKGNTCVAGACSTLDMEDPCNDAKQGPGELDVDCGGACGKCKAGQNCKGNGDCSSGLCQEKTGKCSTWDCQNGMFDPGGEVDVDCGGNCKEAPTLKTCGIGKKCGWDDDCQSNACFWTGNNGDPNVQTFCIPDKCKSFKDNSPGSETGNNCGGPCADLVKVPPTTCWKGRCGQDIFRCPLGETCISNGDCVSGNCIAETGKCGGDKCSDGSKDGDETDVDCGGSCKNKCQHQKVCTGDSDCVAGLVCTNWSKWLNGPGDVKKCMKIDENGKKDLGESDIDCGAKVDSKCTGGQVCVSDGDCAGEGKGELACLKTPFKGQLCVSKGDCKDGQKNGLETDIDCGKGCSAKCQEGKNCLQDGDCAANVCVIKEIEVLPTGLGVPKKGFCKGMCSNSVWDVATGEIDMDCGGPCPLSCPKGAHCGEDADCETGFCWKGSASSQYFKCAYPSCEDYAIAPLETDIDCGGPCKKCQMGQKCKKPSDCFSNECEDGICLPAVCENWKLDEGEPSVDCGGTCPTKCAESKACFVDGDCQKGQCLKGICKFDPCQNSKKDSVESDIDCGDVKYQGAGWKCLKCAAGKACKYGADCESGLCSTGGKCVADACSDGIWSSGEGGVDCGGACPNKCAGSAACIANSDCATGFCATVKKCGSGYCMQPAQCQEPSCDDLSQNGKESDVDCGGGCGGCAVGKKCLVGGDCETGLCADGKCQAKLCENANLDAGEADIDCGGACKACVDGKKCKAGKDCENGMCLPSGVCGYDACLNQKKDKGEADQDCGGVCDVECATGKACKAAKDCQSGYCDGAICVASACEDKQLSPGEAGIDCGAPCATKCATGTACKIPGDCASTFCDGSLCVESACQDKKLSKGETDVDCGGSCTAKCALKAGCKAGSDCQSNVCNGAVCAAGSCWDLKKTDGEGDVDCGGTCQAKCSTGAKCGGDGDCASTICSAAGTCVTSHCDDGKVSGDETALDCGGTCKTKCLAAVACKIDGDCFSGACAVTAKVCVSSACYDQAQNKGETDVDCGGPCKPCTVGQKCAQEGDCNSEACQGQPADGEKCDLCAPTNTCSSGKCALVKVKCPDDGNVCTLEACAAVDGSCSTSAKVCNDGNACTDDTCQPASGCVQAANSAKCEDGNPCTLTDSCSNKACVSGDHDNYHCEDGNQCTLNPCITGQGCTSKVVSCDDNDVCTADSCKTVGGCVNQVIANKCDDGNACTNDSCNPTTGCGHSNNSAPCPDSDQCTINETCSNGACSKQNKVCNDGQECTDDQCSSSAGCVHPPKPAGSSCSAGVCKGTTCCQVASTSTMVFNYNGNQGGPDGSPQQWNVPACATWVQVKARGADGSGITGNWGNQAGRGHTATGYMPGLENKTLIIKVGGKGNALGGQYSGVGAIPGYNGGGGDAAPGYGNFGATGTRGGGGMSSVQVNGASENDFVIIAAGGGASNNNLSYNGRTGGDGGFPAGQNGVGSDDTAGKGGFGESNPGPGGYNSALGMKAGDGYYFQGGGAKGWCNVGGGGGGAGYTGGGGGVSSCNQFPPTCCVGAPAGGGGGGRSHYHQNLQKTSSSVSDQNWSYNTHGQVIITWTAGPSVP